MNASPAPRMTSSKQVTHEHRCGLCGHAAQGPLCYAHDFEGPMMDDDLARRLAFLPESMTNEIQKTLDAEFPGEFEVIRGPDGALAIVMRDPDDHGPERDPREFH